MSFSYRERAGRTLVLTAFLILIPSICLPQTRATRTDGHATPGGGTSGVCDPKENDHQWSVEFLSVSNDITWTDAHRPALTDDVCTTFN